MADNFLPNKRGRVYGYTAVGYNAGAMLGIVLGGVMTGTYSRPKIFLTVSMY